MDFVVYSGTGNTYRVAAWMADVARDAGRTTAVHMVSNVDLKPSMLRGADLLVLATPTHGFTVPPGVLRAAWRLPPGHGRAAAVVATRGSLRVARFYLPGFEGSATLLLGLLLWLKGYRLRGVAAIDMPANWTSLHSGLPEDAVAHLAARARARAGLTMRRWLTGRRDPLPWLTFLVGLLLLPASLAYMVLGRRVLGKTFFASAACTGCGLCAETCPRGAILMRQAGGDQRSPYWTFRCESCMRCMAYCPEEAVEANQLLALGMTVLAGMMPARIISRRLPRLMVGSALSLLALGLISPALHDLLGVTWVNRLATRTTLTHRYRRYHEPETSVGVLVPGPRPR